MEWLKKMMDAIDYIEEHMETSLETSTIATVACSSVFHFQRMFHMLTGYTVAEYVRNRKLTLAAQELTVTKSKVIDIALKYGYETPEAFAKAFKRLHGVSPSAAREQGANLKAFPRMAFHISLKGEKDMDYKIVEKKEFKVVGKSLKVSCKDGENLTRIPQFWSECNENGTCENLCNRFHAEAVLGICMDMDNEKEQFNYMIAVETAEVQSSEEYAIRKIPATTWAVFTSVGPMPGAIQKVWERVFQEWFPATGYEHADAPEIEVYPPGDVNSLDYRCEVWVPIIKK